ncbi:UDP-N-acetylenolpyruvoylglucosamine reductase [Pedobacter sp. BAL39]|uniref:UDP-N-acetylmuramate dehydrogenase n=1 Tax=Pedobacter sp. BAL39 TaxID=391596 RepID=UPI000155976D|nr:UDP-N-acetylmuramate dehydrogenase [Pedobacter sp. BAL39]EDM35704.1 UDP-N-acetylenolpyruvoylglucosamine reductase [Pedobacter sp. BAL39]
MPVLQENISLLPYNTFRLKANARHFVEINEPSDLVALLSSAMIKEERLLVLGGGSNVLFTEDFDGLVIKMSIGGIDARTKGDDVFVTAGAGVVWNDFVGYCVEHGYAGVENLTLIPGTVGASPVQNIGAYGVELKDVFYSCTAYHIQTGMSKVFFAEDCKFGYRESVFKNELKGQYIISSVTFKLSMNAVVNTSYGAIQAELDRMAIAAPAIADVSAAVARIRVSKLPDPSTIGNAGSFFKNPVIDLEQFERLKSRFPDLVHYTMPGGGEKLAAGWLIEQCGFKGLVSGHTGTWKNQALVLVNHGGATGQEVYSFSEKIITTVEAKYGVKLEREVNML